MMTTYNFVQLVDDQLELPYRYSDGAQKFEVARAGFRKVFRCALESLHRCVSAKVSPAF